ncbi:MAG: FAD-dependent oxidoreductase [Bacteroidota bacterium]
MSASRSPQLSYWERNQYFQDLDVLIVGAGIVGLNAALHLHDRWPQLRIAIWERGPLPAGASSRNAGFACFGSVTELLDDLQRHSEEEVLQLLERRWRGLLRLRQILGDQILDYREWGGYEIFRPGEEESYRACCDQLASLNRQIAPIVGQRAVYQRADERIADFGFAGVQHLIVNRAEGQIDTGAMMRGLIELVRSRGIALLNGLGLSHWEREGSAWRAVADNGWELRTQKLLLATNGFAPQLIPELELAPARNQVLITDPIPGLPVKGCFHYDRGYFYFRNIHSRLLLGGGRHLARSAEQTDAFGTSSLVREALLRLLREVILPDREVGIAQWWSGILGLGEQKLPIVRELAPGLVVAVRLGGMGVAIGSLVGQEAADLIAP